MSLRSFPSLHRCLSLSSTPFRPLLPSIATISRTAMAKMSTAANTPPEKILTPALLAALRDSTTLPPKSWYFVAAIALMVVNRPQEIPVVWKYALENYVKEGSGEEAFVLAQYKAEVDKGGPVKDEGQETALTVVRKMREALLKGGVVAGLPKAINALHSLRSGTPPHLLSHPNTEIQPPSPTARISDQHKSVSQLLSRGSSFFASTYGKITPRVHGALDASYEDLNLNAQLMYTYILSNTSVLTAPETSYVMVAGLIPLDVNPQLKGHLVGAINNGASREEVRAVREVVLEIAERAGIDWGGKGRGSVASL